MRYWYLKIRFYLLILAFLCVIFIFNTTRSTTSDRNLLNRVMQNSENDTANDTNTLYHPILPNAINTQEHSTRTSIFIFSYY